MSGLPSPSAKTTALYETHRSLGAFFTDFAGWTMPLRYDSEIAEHRAVRASAGLFDLSHMGEIEVVGNDAARALDYALVSRPSAIKPGRARYSMICAANGGIIDDLVVYRLADDQFLIVANASNATVVAQQLRQRLEGFAVSVNDVSDSRSMVAVQGPNAAKILGSVVPAEVLNLPYYAITGASVASTESLIARTGYTGEDGFEIYCEVSDAETIWDTLMTAGQQHHLRPAGLACRDTLRLEAGMPLYGNELDRTLTPFDAGLGRIVASDKEGGFVGDKGLSYRKSSSPRHVLVGLVTDNRRAPRHGYAVVDPASKRSVGWVTSGAPSPTLGHPIAMAYVAPGFFNPGTPLKVEVRGSHVDVQVVELPFYRRA